MAETKVQLNMRVSPEFANLVGKLRDKYGMSQREVVEWAITRLARSEGFLPPGDDAAALEHVARADRLLSEMTTNVEEARAAVEMALGALDPLPGDGKG